ncbi:MAG TPA: GNAT family N-acetyltransferase [Puia sp.]|nr:GNAT family N-acetyltransferase [Puia sp.]
MIEVNVTNDPKRQQFQVNMDGEAAFLEYRWSEGVLVLMHTEVPDKLGGRGIGSALAAYAFRYAMEREARVKVYCPFVAAWLKKHPEWREIVVTEGGGR